MLELSKDQPSWRFLSQPNKHAIELLGQVLEANSEPIIAEIGVGIGATSIELCRAVGVGGGLVYFFDYDSKLAELDEDLRRAGFANFVMIGNTRKTFSSYTWELARLLAKLRAAGSAPLFDLAFLDGSHRFHHDAPAAIILKDLLKPGGYILLDDYDWCATASPTVNPTVLPKMLDAYTQEQLETAHVKLVCDLFFDPDPNFRKVDLGYGEREHRRAYQKVG